MHYLLLVIKTNREELYDHVFAGVVASEVLERLSLAVLFFFKYLEGEGGTVVHLRFDFQTLELGADAIIKIKLVIIT